jgi:hypothetical protein
MPGLGKTKQPRGSSLGSVDGSTQDSKRSRCSLSKDSVHTSLSALFQSRLESGETYVERTKLLIERQIEEARKEPTLLGYKAEISQQHGTLEDSKLDIFEVIKYVLPDLKTTKIELDQLCKLNKDAANEEAEKENDQDWTHILETKNVLDKEVDEYIGALWLIEESIVFKLGFYPQLANVEFLIPKVANSDGTPERPSFQTLLSISIDYGLSYLLQILLKLKNPLFGFDRSELSLVVFYEEKTQYLEQLEKLRDSYKLSDANYDGYNSSILKLSHLKLTLASFVRAEYPEPGSKPQTVFVGPQVEVSPLPSQEYDCFPLSSIGPGSEGSEETVFSMDSADAETVSDHGSVVTGKDSLLSGMNKLIDSLALSSAKLHKTIEKSDSEARGPLPGGDLPSGGTKSKKSKKSKCKSKRKSKKSKRKSRKTKRTK